MALQRKLLTRAAIVVVCLIPLFFACKSPLATTHDANDGLGAARALAAPILTSPDKKGTLTVLDAASNKYLVHLEGTAYAMGYQHGYLLAEKVKETCSLGFFRAIVSDFLGSDPTLAAIINNDTAFSAILDTVQTLALTQTIYATEDMRQEMKGIAAGAKKRLGDLGLGTGSVCYERIVLMNMAFDVILAYVYPTIVKDYLDGGSVATIDTAALTKTLHMCDGFVAKSSATATGGTIMTRSFMITDLLGASSIIMEYAPSSGYKFVAVNPPGFVGTPAGMNQKGVSIGMDMVPALNTNAGAPGMGCLLTARYVLQNSKSVSTAMTAIKNSVARGVPWMYIVGDTTTGAIAEAAATTGLGWMSDQAKYFAARYVDYSFDASAYPQAGIDQTETRSDLVIVSNHFIDPTVRKASGSYAVDESKARYDYLVPTIQAAIDSGLDVAKAKNLVNYLSPLSDNPYGNDIMNNPFGEGRPVSATTTRVPPMSTASGPSSSRRRKDARPLRLLDRSLGRLHDALLGFPLARA